jgi:hypothetical protein
MSTGSKKRAPESIDHISDGEPISKKSKMAEPAEVGEGVRLFCVCFKTFVTHYFTFSGANFAELSSTVSRAS